MKTLKAVFVALVLAAMLVALYVSGVRNLEKLGLELFHQVVTKNLVKDQQELAGLTHFSLGLYRPELPYQFDKLYMMQESLGVKMSIVSYYQAWGDGREFEFQADVNENLDKGGFVPLITWEPWVSAFKQYSGQKPDSSLAIIAQGAFDGYVRAWARAAVVYGRPFFLRIGHEMSNPWYSWSVTYGNSPETYKAFWKRVHRIFREEGARNVAFVWNPYTPQDTACYPGNDYVDWIGLDIFNFGSLSEEGFWMDFYTVTKILYDAVKGYEKPIIVAEAGCAASGGNKNNWYRDMFHSLAVGNFPAIKGLVLFDTPIGVTPTGIPVDLGISSDSTVYSALDRKNMVQKLNITTNKKGELP